MQKLLYTLHFVSQTSRLPGDTEVMRTTGSGASCVVTTNILPSGLKTNLAASEGELAFFESQLRLTGPEQFDESGEISFGDDGEHILRFSTIGRGHIDLECEPGVMAGGANLKVEGGEGQFNGARGFIASNFTINGAGERSDYHCGMIFLP